MNTVQRLSIGAKLWAGVALIVVMQVAVIVSVGATSARLTAESEAILSLKSEKVQLATRWAGLVETNVTRVQAQIISNNSDIDALYRELIPQTVEAISQVQKRLESLDLDDNERQLMARIAQQRQTVLDALAQARALQTQGDAVGAQSIIATRFNPAVPPYIASLNEFAQLQGTLLVESQKVFADRRQANVVSGTS